MDTSDEQVQQLIVATASALKQLNTTDPDVKMVQPAVVRRNRLEQFTPILLALNIPSCAIACFISHSDSLLAGAIALVTLIIDAILLFRLISYMFKHPD